jgi:hypothetical protein
MMGRAQQERYLLVTLDTEVDKDPSWRIASPPSYKSVTHGVPELFTPLFRRHGVRPTYLLSGEVLEDDASCRVLAQLGDEAELGTHLHVDFVHPGRRLFPENMAGESANGIQAELGAPTEWAKIATITELFASRFGYAPVSFRAGRYGMSSSTLSLLAELGYLVDSSVTPGLRWNYREGVIDFRKSPRSEQWLHTTAGRILELPVSVRPGSPLAPFIHQVPGLPGRVIRRLLGARGDFLWLRPSWSSGDDLIRYVQQSSERFLVMMLHSMEVIPGASPYAHDEEGARRILSAMDQLFAYCAKTGIRFCTMAEAAQLCRP